MERINQFYGPPFFYYRFTRVQIYIVGDSNLPTQN